MDKKKTIMVVDGQGGGIGKSIIESLRKSQFDGDIIAVGTNSFATSNMMKGGTTLGATGENAVLYNSRRCQVIAGPIGIVMANAMLGEITPAMAEAVSASEARLVLIPMNKCRARIVGVEDKKLAEYMEDAVTAIMEACREDCDFA